MASSASPRKHNDRKAIQTVGFEEIDCVIDSMCNPWEYGGHSHDFIKTTHPRRASEISPFNEHDPVFKRRQQYLTKRNESLGRVREMKSQVIQTLVKVVAVHSQRCRNEEARKLRGEPPSSVSPCNDEKPAKNRPHYMNPTIPCSKAAIRSSADVGNNSDEHRTPPSTPPSHGPPSKEMLELDEFDNSLEAMLAVCKETQCADNSNKAKKKNP